MMSSPIPPAGHIPPQFLETLVDLDAGVTKTVAAEKSATKKMAPVKAKAVTGLRQTLKKRTKEFENVLETYKKDPAAYREAYDKANTAPPVKKVAGPKTTQSQEPEEGQEDNFATVGRGGRVKNFTDKDVLATLKEIAEQRGRKVSCPYLGEAA
jgi:translation initiation factor 3 subunit C